MLGIKKEGRISDNKENEDRQLTACKDESENWGDDRKRFRSHGRED